MLQGFQFHFIGKGFFARQDFLPLEVAVHHDNSRFVIIQCPNEYRHGGLTRQLTPPLAPVARYDLIAALLPGADDTGRENAASCDTLHCFLHRFIIPYLEGMIFEREQL